MTSPAESRTSVASDLVARVEAAVPHGAPVVLAVSGGSDSMGLLAAAWRGCPSRVIVAHVDHALRPESRREAELVASVCRTLGLPCLLLRAPPGPRDAGRNETAARRRRLGALQAAARQVGAAAVLTAHHRGDDLETVLVRLQRGHRTDRALAGMPSSRPFAPADSAPILLLRPFLAEGAERERADLEAVRREAGLPHAEDASNSGMDTPRNRWRVALAADGGALAALVDRVRRGARRRLRARLARACHALARHLRVEGGGCRLQREAWLAADTEDQAELVRLWALALRHPRHVDVRATVLADLARAVQGTLVVPAEPRPLRLVASRAGVHAPAEPLRAPPGEALALWALACCPRVG